MAKAVICPVCNGSGKLTVRQDYTYQTTSANNNVEVMCHGCGGKGWVEVAEDYVPYVPYQPYVPYVPYPYQPWWNPNDYWWTSSSYLGNDCTVWLNFVVGDSDDPEKED